MTTTILDIPDWSSPGKTRAASNAFNQSIYGAGNPYGICIGDNTVIGKWNVWTLSANGKLYEHLYKLKRYQLMIIGISEIS